MVKIAIVEDCKEEALKLQDILNAYSAREGVKFDISMYDNADKFLFEYDHSADLVFMDIEMPGMNGMEAAEKLREEDESVVIVFVTNMAGFAVRGYQVDAADFIVKPLNAYEFNLKIERILSRVKMREGPSIMVESDGKLYRILADSIRYIEVQGHYVIFHTTGGEYTEYSTLKNVESKLNMHGFFARCNASYLINLRYVQSVTGNSVHVSGGGEVPIGRSKKKGFYAAFAAYVAGKPHSDV